MSVRGASFIILQIPNGKYIREEWGHSHEGCSLILYGQIPSKYDCYPDSVLEIFVIKRMLPPNLSNRSPGGSFSVCFKNRLEPGVKPVCDHDRVRMF